MVAFQRRGILEPGRVGPTWSSNNISTLVSLSKVGGWVYPRYSNTYCFGNRPSVRLVLVCLLLFDGCALQNTDLERVKFHGG